MALATAELRKKNRPAPKRRSVWRRLFVFFLVLFVLGAAAVCVTYGMWASTFDMAVVKEMPSRSTVYDMNGEVYSRFAGENRIVVPLAKVSPNFKEALLAREDSRFYQHRGVDPAGILRAVFRNVFSGSAQGASTITQQLARNSYPDRISGQTKNAHRKLLEAFVALRIEQHYTKDEILENYVNRIYFGAGGIFGVESASLTYFGKHAADLDLAESALLAGIIRGPGFYSPFDHLDRAIAARNAVLDRMVKLRQITERDAGEAKRSEMALRHKRPPAPEQNYAMAAVQSEVGALLTEEQRMDGGLKIYTTIDPALQKAAEAAVDAELRKVEAKPGYSHPKRAQFTERSRDEEGGTPYLQGAVVVIENRTGALRAIVGGRDYAESNFNRAVKAKRQAGSTFKPFVYAAAYRRGILPGMLVDDGRIVPGEIRGGGNWSPANSDGTFKGPLPAEEGLIQSRNTMSVRIGNMAGMDEVAQTAAAAGLSGMTGQPSSFIGAFDTSLAQLTTAYTVFPNEGLRRQSYVIERIDDASGDVLYRAAHIQATGLDPAVSWLITSELGKVMERGTAASSRSLGWSKPSAGKTGTTNDFKDAWFVGFTTSLTCGVWVGLDRPEPIAPHGYGAALALPIWVDVMNAASPRRYPSTAFRPPSPLERVNVCAVSNKLATDGCDSARSSYAIELPASLVPRDSCNVHRGGVLYSSRRGEAPGAPGRRSLPDSIFHSFRRFFGGD